MPLDLSLLPDKQKSKLNIDLLPDKPKRTLFESAKRYGKGILGGAIGTVEGTARAVEAFSFPTPKLTPQNVLKSTYQPLPVTLAQSVKPVAKWIADKSAIARKFYEPPDPKFADMLASGAGSMAGFLIPGVGVSKAVTATNLTPKMAAWLGTSASSVLEAMTEGGFAYSRAKEKGLGEKEAVGAATKVFWANLPVLVFTNKLGIFGEKGSTIRKVLISSPIEAVQEYTQQIIGNIATKDPTFQGAIESALVGGIIGGGAGGAMGALESSVKTPQKPSLIHPTQPIAKDILTEQRLKYAEAEREPTTEFGKLLKGQMIAEKNIPLHPAEAGREELKKIYPLSFKQEQVPQEPSLIQPSLPPAKLPRLLSFEKPPGSDYIRIEVLKEGKSYVEIQKMIEKMVKDKYGDLQFSVEPLISGLYPKYIDVFKIHFYTKGGAVTSVPKDFETTLGIKQFGLDKNPEVMNYIKNKAKPPKPIATKPSLTAKPSLTPLKLESKPSLIIGEETSLEKGDIPTTEPQLSFKQEQVPQKPSLIEEAKGKTLEEFVEANEDKFSGAVIQTLTAKPSLTPLKLESKPSLIIGEETSLEKGAISTKFFTKPIELLDKNVLQSEISLLSPEGKLAMRRFIGGTNSVQRMRENIINALSHLEGMPANKALFERAMYGDQEAFNALPKELQQLHTKYREMITNQTELLANRLDSLLDSTEIDEKLKQIDFLRELFPEQEAGYAREGGKLIQPKELARIIRNNKEYLYRFYDRNYTPTTEERSAAVAYFTEKGLSDNKANQLVNDIIAGNSFEFEIMGKKIKVSKGSYRYRHYIPLELRKIMGEITDPIKVISTTYARVSAFVVKYDLYEAMAKTKDVANEQVNLTADKEKNWRRMPDDKLSWGELAGKYVSPDLYGMLNDFYSLHKYMLKNLSNMTMWVKAGKTVFNIANWVQQPAGNFEGSLQARNFILNPLRWGNYIKAVKTFYGKNDVLLEKLIKEGIADTTYMHSGDFNYMLDYFSKPTSETRLIRLLKHFGNRISNLWGSFDQIFKISSVINQMQNFNKTMPEAVEETSKWFFMFSEPSRAMKYLQSNVAGRFGRELFTNAFIAFKMARNVNLGNIFKNPRSTIIWAGLRSMRKIVAVALGSTAVGMVSDFERKKWEKFKKNNKIKVALGDIVPIVVKGKIIPVEDRLDPYKLSDILSLSSYIGQNIIAEAVNAFADNIEFSKGSKIGTVLNLVERLAPQVISIPLQMIRLQQQKADKTPYMQEKLTAKQKEKAISGTTAVRPFLSQMMEKGSKAQEKYEELKKLPNDESKRQYYQIKKENPSLARSILSLRKDEKKGITEEDKEIRAMGVENLERANFIYERVNELKTRQEKLNYLNALRRKKIITDEVKSQIIFLDKKLGLRGKTQ